MTRARLKAGIYTLAIFGGCGLINIEVSLGKMAQPLFGESLTLWVMILAGSLAGLATGYFLSKRLNGNHLGLLYVLQSLYILFIPVLLHFSESFFMNTAVNTGLLIYYFLFVFPVMAIWGTLSPLLIRFWESNESDHGPVSGTIFGWSTLGGLCCTAPVFMYLIPKYGLSSVFVLHGSIFFLCFCLFYLFKKGLE